MPDVLPDQQSRRFHRVASNGARNVKLLPPPWRGGPSAQLVQSRAQLIHRAADAAGRVTLRHQREESLEAAQRSADAIEPLVHHRCLAPQIGVVRRDAQHVLGTGQRAGRSPA